MIKEAVVISGLLFGQYEAVTSRYLANGTKAEGRNEFDISRVYLNAAAPVGEKVDLFLQFEANLLSRDNTANQVFVKQANLTFKEVYPGAKVIVGLAQTLWAPLDESLWKHRFVAKVFTDEEGLTPTTDRGVRLSGKIPRLDYELMVSNGEGTGARSTAGNETSKHKDVSARLSVSPFSGELAGLRAHAFGLNGQKFAGWAKDRAIGALSYEKGGFTATAEYVMSRDGSNGSVLGSTATVHGAGYSVHTVVPVAAKCWVFGRFDHWDPDTATADNARSRVIAGFGHQIEDAVRISLDYQYLLQEKQAAARRDQALTSVHLEAKF